MRDMNAGVGKELRDTDERPTIFLGRRRIHCNPSLVAAARPEVTAKTRVRRCRLEFGQRCAQFGFDPLPKRLPPIHLAIALFEKLCDFIIPSNAN